MPIFLLDGVRVQAASKAEACAAFAAQNNRIPATCERVVLTKAYVCLTCRTTFDVDASEVHYCACETCKCSRYTGRQCTQLCHEQEEDGMDSFVPDWPKTTMCANCEDGFSVRESDFEAALEARTETRQEERR